LRVVSGTDGIIPATEGKRFNMNLPVHTAIKCALLAGALILVCLGACAADDGVGRVQFVESFPAETPLDLEGLEEAATVWPRVIKGSQHRFRVASFYFSRIGDGEDAPPPEGTPDYLDPILAELAKAAGRGVQVQLLADGNFQKTYPQVPAWLDNVPGAEARILDADALWGGVLHAKYFLSDDDLLFVGSQNWDWRALDQIHELGVLVRHPHLATDLGRIFDMDWELADTDPPLKPAADVADHPQGLFHELPGHPVVTDHGDTLTALLAASPAAALPEGIPWDLPLLVEMIDAAQDSIHLQLLSYGVTDRENRFFDHLDRALRRAAVRGAQVRIILSNWSKSSYRLPWIKSLAVLPNVEIRFTNIPEYSGGFIPYARVEHAKFLTVDSNILWIGTSNWSRGYFFDSRNISLFFHGPGATRDPDRFFNLSWHGPYAETVDAAIEYAPPQRH
jgi:phosphatidylserine/phosphatidylglycerophosphate/cardiolipin synthase-like enzyme